MFIKVCGITSVDDALMAEKLGADAIGIVFHPKSPRYVSVAEALKIIEAVKGKLKVVGVFKYKSELNELLDILDFIQIYEPISFMKEKLILAVSGKTEHKATFFIIDSSHGRGIRSEYPLDLFGLPREKVIISGGLTPYNVDYLIRKYKPFGVDVSSGVELRKGVKSYYLLEEFVKRARGVQ